MTIKTIVDKGEDLHAEWETIFCTKVEGRGWRPLGLRLRRLACGVLVLVGGLVFGLIWLMLSVVVGCFYPYTGKVPDWSLFAKE